MKNLFLIALILIGFNSNSQTFGPDRIVYNNPNVEVHEIFLQTAFNGWIYAAFNYYDMPYKGYRVDYSTDNGQSWQTVIDFSVPGASAWYPQIVNMLVAGTDTNNLHVFLALLGNGNGGPTNYGSINTYGATSGTVLNTIGLGDFMTYTVGNLSLCSDYKHPMSLSSPYSIAAVYTAGEIGRAHV